MTIINRLSGVGVFTVLKYHSKLVGHYISHYFAMPLTPVEVVAFAIKPQFSKLALMTSCAINQSEQRDRLVLSTAKRTGMKTGQCSLPVFDNSHQF